MLSNIISLAIKNLAINDHTSFHDENLKNDFNSVFLVSSIHKPWNMFFNH